MLRLCTCKPYSLSDPSGCNDMIVFNEYTVKKTETVIVPSTGSYCIFVKKPQTRSCLSRVGDLDLHSFGLPDISICQSRYA